MTLRLLTLAAAAAATVAAPAADVVTSLPGWSGALPSNWYSGYLQAGSGRHYHYVLIESERSPASDPIVVWQNGGPGCSSLEGLLAELGQLHVVGAVPGSGSPTNPPSLYRNPHAWSNLTTTVFIETPSCVGFSYADSPDGCTTDDKTGAAYTQAALVDLFTRAFPEYARNDLYLAGESYAGIYVPQLALAVLQYNAGSPAVPLNLKGIAVGNGAVGRGWLNPTLASFSYPQELQVYMPFFRAHGLISKPLYDAVQAACPDPSNPAPGAACHEAIDAAHNVIGPVDTYNVLYGCDIPAQARSLAGSSTLRAPANALPEGKLDVLGSYGPVECISDPALENYLAKPSVRTALHVPQDIQWSVCTSNSSFHYNRSVIDETVDTYPVLIAHGVRVLIFSGDQDACIPWTGSELWTSSLGLPVSTPWHPYLSPDNSTVYGYATAYSTQALGPGGFTFATVKGAGHMVPEYQPEAALALFTRFVTGQAI